MLELYLGLNRLVKIKSNTFQGLKELKKLDLSENQINSIEPNAFNIESLEKLFLSKNQLTIIEKHSFVGLKNLRILHLNDNQIKAIETKSLDGFKDLEEFNLLFNPGLSHYHKLILELLIFENICLELCQ